MELISLFVCDGQKDYMADWPIMKGIITLTLLQVLQPEAKLLRFDL